MKPFYKIQNNKTIYRKICYNQYTEVDMMIIERPSIQKKLEKEFKYLEEKNATRFKVSKKHHISLREQVNNQSIRVSKRMEQFNSQSK